MGPTARVRGWMLAGIAVVGSALGLVVLGARASADERGAVAATLAAHQASAAAHARAVVGALPSLLADPTATFVIDGDGTLRSPTPTPFVDAPMPVEPGDSACDRDIVACVRAARQHAERARALLRARRDERAPCVSDGCARAQRRARDAYGRLRAYPDTWAEAWLGLGRLARARGDLAAAEATVAALAAHPEAQVDGVPVGVIADLARGLWLDSPEAWLRLATGLAEGRLLVSEPVAIALWTEVTRGLETRTLRDPDAQVWASARRTWDALGQATDRARALMPEVAAMVATAQASPRGIASTGRGATLVYHRRPDGQIEGREVDATALAALATADDLRRLADRAQVRVLPVGDVPADARVLAQVPFGETLPHLTLAIVNPWAAADPLDLVIDARARRHLLWSALLGVGLLGGLAAFVVVVRRERELARQKSEFVATVSHELKTPLTSIRMFAEMLQAGVDGDDRARGRSYQDVIVKEAERLGALIGNLLDYAQIERGTRRYRRGPIDLAAVAADAVRAVTTMRTGATHQVPITVVADAQDAQLDSDAEALTQVVINLLTNAIKYAGETLPITVRVTGSPTAVTLTVEDLGPGIARDDEARIFEQFYRSAGAYASGVAGTGLGLALVKRHVEALGGTVRVHRTRTEASGLPGAGPGATFEVRLPRGPGASS